MHRIKVNGEVRDFSLDLETLYQAEMKNGVRIGYSDLSPMSFGAMVKFAWAGFMAEDPEIKRETAISWLQAADLDALSGAILEDMQSSGLMGKATPAKADGDPLSMPTDSTGDSSDTSG